MEQSVPVSLQELAVKCMSKKELYDLLCTSCDVYLPPIQFANASYVRGIVTGELNVIMLPNDLGLAHMLKQRQAYSRADDTISLNRENSGVCT